MNKKVSNPPPFGQKPPAPRNPPPVYVAYWHDELLSLLRESQASIGGDWRERRDALIARIDRRP